MAKARWGVWDRQDRCWLGDDAGPKLFEDRQVARAAAMVIAVQLGWSQTRTEGRRYDGGGARLKDEIVIKMSAHTALRKIEGGAV